MLRNELITRLSDYNNDNVVVSIGGIQVDVDSVFYDRGSVVLVLDPEDALSTLVQIAATRPIPDRTTAQE